MKSLANLDTCWSYLVVSSDAQAETLLDQRKWAEETAAQNGWALTRTFEGVSSGAKGTRELLIRLLEELRRTPKADRPARILTVRLDRVGRMALDSLATLAEIHKLGVRLHTRDNGDSNLDDVMGVLREVFGLATAQIENQVRSEKWKAVHARRKAAGLHVGSVPFGVTLIDGRAIPYEPEAWLVRQIFELAAQGWGYTRLATFARERASAKRWPDGSDRPYRWAPSTIKTLMDSKTLRGLVVDEELWRRARDGRFSDFKTRSAHRWPWPLVGALRCSCGRMVRGHASGVPNYRIRYMTCFDPSHGRPYPAHRADRIEEQFVALLGRLTADDDFLLDGGHDAALEAAQGRKRGALANLDRVEKRRAKVWAFAEDGTLPAEQVRERLSEIEADRARARQELDAAERDVEQTRRLAGSIRSVRTVLETAPAVWEAATVEQRREIAKAVAELVGGLYVSPDAKHTLLVGESAIASHATKKGQTDDSITKKFIQSITE